jgi:4-hydroxy-4-methyl-2-oxoglutarate aldolase
MLVYGKVKMYKINGLKERPSKEIIKELSAFGTAMIADSMGRYGAMKPYIRPVVGKTKLAGPAFTVQTYRSDNLMLHVALELAEEGDVLVVDAGEVINAGLWGGLMTTMALKKKLGGVVTDGAIRDSQEIIESGLPVFSKSISPLGGFKESPGSVNIQISCGGVVVNPGDIIIGDDDGVAVIPINKATEVLELCKKTDARETLFRKGMNEGKSLFELLNLKKKLENINIKLPLE